MQPGALKFFPLDGLPANLAAGNRRRIEEVLQDPARTPRAGDW